MDYNVTVSESRTYILVKVIGRMTVEVGKIVGQIAHDLARQNNINKMLNDLRYCINTEKPEANISFSYKNIPRASNNIFDKVAFLVAPDDRSHDLIYITMSNAGHNTCMFTDEIDAIKWLEM